MVHSRLLRLILLPAASIGSLVMLGAPWFAIRVGAPPNASAAYANLFGSDVVRGGTGSSQPWYASRFDGVVGMIDVRAYTTIVVLMLLLTLAWLALESLAALKGERRCALARLVMAPTAVLGVAIGSLMAKNAIAEGTSQMLEVATAGFFDNMAAGSAALLVTVPILGWIAVLSLRETAPIVRAQLTSTSSDHAAA